MAIAIDPNIGMPHNQLGTIAGNKNYGLDAVYHYMRRLVLMISCYLMINVDTLFNNKLYPNDLIFLVFF